MAVHQVVVVLDVNAPDRLSAARCAVGILNGTRGWYTLPEGQAADTQMESWWFPEHDLKQVDRNDNGAFVLVEDAPVPCPVCDGGGEITVCANDGTHGCSHVNDREYRCAACTGLGEVLSSQIANPDWCEQCGLTGECDRCAA